MELKNKGINPKLAVIMVGDDEASKVYVKNKSKACEECGIDYEEFLMDKDIDMEELLETIDKLNKRDDIHGILLQSPIPSNLDINQAFNKIKHKKDVDGFNPINVGKLSIGEDCFVSCTPAGVIKMLEEYNIEIEGKNVVIIGRSNIVGKPLIPALGKPKFVTQDMIKDGAVIIDVGINRTEDGKLVGDVDFENVKNNASYITPVPGGVGPMTIAMLMTNVVKAAKNK